MSYLAAARSFFNPFEWFLNLGKADCQHIKDEISDLLQHASQSLRSLNDLPDILEEIPQHEFTRRRFWPVANNCQLFFTSPEAAQKARTHCTDIKRDIAMIDFKAAKVLRAKDLNWRGIDAAFHDLMYGDADFLRSYEHELARIGRELTEIGKLVDQGEKHDAFKRYEALRASLFTTRRNFSDEIAMMRRAQTHIHELLT